MKKALSLILTLVILLGLASPVFADDGLVTISLVPSKTEVAPGESFTVDVNIDKSLENIIAYQVTLWWNSDMLTYNGAENRTENCATNEIGDPSKGPGKVFLNMFAAVDDDANPYNIVAGTLGTFSFTAKEGVTGSPELELEIVEIYKEDFTQHSYTANNQAASLTIVEKAAVTGYTVTASEDKNIVAGENATVTVTVGGDQATYNAYDLTLTYDTDKLTYVSGVAADQDASVTEANGTIRVVGYGADKAIDTTALTLTFQGKAIGDANVVISSAKVDISSKAIGSDAPEATILDDTTVITIQGYTVNLGEGLSGESTVAPGADYTFSATDWDNYDYVVSGTMGGEDVEIIDNGDGTYTVKNVTGNLDISATMTPKSYTVTINGEDTTGAATATYNTPYTFTVDKKDGFTYDVTVTVGGNAYTGYTVENGTYTIPGTDITGDIVITVTKTPIPVSEYTVTVEGAGAGDVTAAATAKAGEDFTFTLNKVTGFAYEITATMGGETAEVIDNGDGSYTIKAVSGDIVITVGKVSDLTVDVVEYITLDEQSVFLVTVSGTIAEGSVAKYDGMAMFWSEKYDAYAWLVISADSLENVKAEAAEKVTISEGTAAGTVDYSGDVNGTELVDVNDAQLTYDLYNAKYADFETVSMLKFLNADVNYDKTVNVNDAAAIVNIILN